MARVQIAVKVFDYYVEGVLCHSVEGEPLNPQVGKPMEETLLAMRYIKVGEPSKVEALATSLDASVPTIERVPNKGAGVKGVKGVKSIKPLEAPAGVGVTEVTTESQLGSALVSLDANAVPLA